MFAFTEEQKMAQQAIRMWAANRLAPKVEALEEGRELPYDLMRDLYRTFGLTEMVRAGWKRRLKAPGGAESSTTTSTTTTTAISTGEDEESVGAMGDMGMQAVLAIELSRVCPGFMLALGASVGLTGGAIMRRGTPAQQERWGLPVLLLEKIGGWGMTEPGAGSDAFGSMRTTARRDGDDYVLNGQKTFITNAPFADVLVIYAKIPEAGGGSAEDARRRRIHAFVVERGTPGLETPPPMKKMGMHTSPTGEVFLSDVRVPADHLLGETELSEARDNARSVFHGERAGMAPMTLGIIERCLEDSVKYAKERHTWGQPIASYQLVQEKLARMYVHRENVRNMLFKQIWLARKRRELSDADASACKLYCARAATECALEAVQIMGGNGYMREYHVEMLMRDAKLLQIGGGTDEIQIVHIARALVDAP